VYTAYPRSWREHRNFEFLPTLQQKINEFQVRLCKSLEDNPDQAIHDWFKDNQSANVQPEVVEQPVNIDRRQNVKAGFYLLIWVLACILFELEFQVSNADKSKNRYRGSDSNSESMQNLQAIDHAVVLMFGCGATAIAYACDLFGIVEQGIESVSNTMILSHRDVEQGAQARVLNNHFSERTL
jgi:hypothetical protein